MQNLRLNAAGRRAKSFSRARRSREVQPKVVPIDHARNRLGWRMQRRRRVAGKRDPLLRGRAVLPLRALMLNGQHAGSRLLAQSVCEDARLRNRLWKIGVLAARVVALERVNCADVVIEEIKFAVVVFAKRDDTRISGRVISGISTTRLPSNRAAHSRRVSQSPKM